MANYSMEGKKVIRITLEERQQIEKLLRDGLRASAIARIIGRGKNSVVVEIRRAGGRDNYNAKRAQDQSHERFKKKTDASKANSVKYCEDRIDEIKSLIEKGETFWHIRKRLGLGYMTLLNTFKKLNVPPGNAYTMIQEVHDKIYSIQEQLDVIFEILKEKK